MLLFVEYATHRPSGENTEPIGLGDSTSSKRVLFLSWRENNQSVTLEPLVTVYRKRSPDGAHDSGTCAVSGSAFVNCSAMPLPSPSCQKMLRLPSRSD